MYRLYGMLAAFVFILAMAGYNAIDRSTNYKPAKATVYEVDRARYQGGQPGLNYDGGRWLADHDVTAVACDNAAVGALAMHGSFDAGPDEDLHLLLLWSRGIYLLEMLWLEELARTGRHDFLFVAAPLTIEGGTGSPVNPVAVL